MSNFDQEKFRRIEKTVKDMLINTEQLNSSRESFAGVASALRQMIVAQADTLEIEAASALDHLLLAAQHTIMNPGNTAHIRGELDAGCRSLRKILERTDHPVPA